MSMRGITGGSLGATGPTPLFPTGASGIKPMQVYKGLYIRAVSGTAWLGGSSGVGCASGVGLQISAGEPVLKLDIENPRGLYVHVATGGRVNWLIF